MPRSRALSLVTPALAAPSLLPSSAQAAPLTIGGVFGEAHVFMQLIMAGLIVATLAAVVLCVLKLASGPRLTGGSAFISGLRFGGPLLGLLGASFTGLYAFLGIANVGAPVPMHVIAPGLAEAALLTFLGLLAGAVAVICHWAVEARIDRTVLKG